MPGARGVAVGSHDEHDHGAGHAVARAARRRQPRSDPRARRPREQPQGRQRRDPEAPADGVHRRLGLGQELAGLRHDRRRVAAADQRDLQRLRPGLHADAGAARRRRARRTDDGDHRRPGADGRQPALDGRHRHRRQRDAAHPLQPARAAAHRLAPGLLVQRPVGPRQRAITVERGGAKTEKATFTRHRRHVPALRGPGHGLRHRPRRSSSTTSKSLAEGAITVPGLHRGRLELPPLRGLRLRRPGQADPRLHREGAPRLPLPGADPDEGRRHQHDLRGAGAARSRSRSCPRTRSRCSRTSGRSWTGRSPSPPAPTAAAPASAEAARSSRIKGLNIADACAMQISDLAEWVRGLDEPSVAPLLGAAAAHARLVRRDRARLPVARPAVGDAVGRRGAARQDDPPPRVVAHRRHLRLRRADHRPAPPRRPADERAAAAAARQGQHGARGRARAGGDRDRRPRRRPRPRRRHRRAATVCFEGTVDGLRASDTLTGRHLDDRAALKPRPGRRPARLEIRDATPAQPAGRRASTSRSACCAW